ncbi:hypothetical protein ACLB2K_044749 [Fragaria x ananassa]
MTSGETVRYKSFEAFTQILKNEGANSFAQILKNVGAKSLFMGVDANVLHAIAGVGELIPNRGIGFDTVLCMM